MSDWLPGEGLAWESGEEAQVVPPCRGVRMGSSGLSLSGVGVREDSESGFG